MPGDAVRRGPSESNSTCARCGSCELSLPMDQMRRRTGSSTAKPDGCGKPCGMAVRVTAAIIQAANKATRTSELLGECWGMRSLRSSTREWKCGLEFQSIPHFGHDGLRIVLFGPVRTKSVLLVERPCLPVFLGDPERKLVVSAAAEFCHHVIHQDAPVAFAAKVG